MSIVVLPSVAGGGGGGIFVIPPAVDFDHGACEVALQVEESNALSRLVENLE